MKRTTTYNAIGLGVVIGWLLVTESMAQFYVRNTNTTVVIRPSTPVVVEGDLQNNGTIHNATADSPASNNTSIIIKGNAQNSGTIFNFGTITLAGNWDNQSDNAIYSDVGNNTNGGTFILNGSTSTKQIIKHKGQNFHTLILDGTAEKQLEGDATVTNRLVLNTGILTPSNNSVFLLNDNVTIDIDGGSVDSYINGKLFHQGTSNVKVFPIGKDNMYAPLYLTDLMGTTDPQIVTGFEAFKTNPYTQTGLGLSRVSTARYWERTQLKGSISQGKVVLRFDEQDNIADLESVVVGEAKSINAPFRSIGKGTVSGSTSEGTVSSRESIEGKVFAVGLTSTGGQMDFFFIPNAFSPASSSEEDKVLKIYGTQLFESNFTFSVFDRWGNLVYESRSIEEMTTRGWEGNNQLTGRPQMPGVYTYLLRTKLASGQPFQKAGTITLIR